MKEPARRSMIAAAARLLARGPAARALERWHGRRGGVVLAYHEVSYDTLSRQLDLLSPTFRYVPLTELADRLAGGRSTSGLAAVTFDDGYGPTIEAAARLARQRGWPMTFYLPTAFLDTGEPHWFQELEELVARAAARGPVEPLEALRARFKSLSSADEIEALRRSLRLAATGSERRPAGLAVSPPVSWKRVRELAGRQELSFEAHSVHHLAMSRLSEAALRREMERSRARIEEASGRPVTHFCYPYGDPADIGAAAPRVARQLFKSATTMIRGRCRAGADPALLPRVPLFERDEDDVTFLKVALAR